MTTAHFSYQGYFCQRCGAIYEDDDPNTARYNPWFRKVMRQCPLDNTHLQLRGYSINKNQEDVKGESNKSIEVRV